jgi:predicted PurR-regulated permease PerM
MGKGAITKVFFVTLLCALALVLSLFWTYATAIILALLIASAFYPLYSRLRRFLGGRDSLAALLVVAVILLVLVIPVGGLLGSLSKEALELYGKTRESVSLKKIQDAIQGDSLWAKRLRKAEKLLGIDISADKVEELAASVARNVGLYLSRQLSAMGSNLLNFLVHFFLMVLIIYFIFRDGARLKNSISELLPFPPEQQNLLVNRFRQTARAIIVGNGINGLIQGILGGLGFMFFGLGSPILWGTFIAFAALLPLVGSTIVFVPATLVLLIQGKTGLAVGFLIYNGLYTAVMEYGVKPKLIGKEMHMSSLLVFIGILGGMKMFGILGIIYGPLIMTIFLTLVEIYRLEYRDTLS